MRNRTNKAVAIALHWDDERADLTFGTADACHTQAATASKTRQYQAVFVVQRPMKASALVDGIRMASITMPDDNDVTTHTAADLIQRVRDLLQDEAAITPEAAVHLEYMFEIVRDHTVPLDVYRDLVVQQAYLLESGKLLREAQRGHDRAAQRDAERSFDTLLKKLKRTNGDALKATAA